MDAYHLLREQARKKRDDAIDAAREQYAETMRAIRELARGMGDDAADAPEPAWLSIKQAVMTLCPTSRVFSAREMVRRLRADDPTRPVRSGSVRCAIQELVQRGELRRACWGEGGEMLFAGPDCDANAGPLATLTCCDAVAKALQERGPMRPAEVAVWLTDHGFRPSRTQRSIYAAVYHVLTTKPERFRQNGDGRWQASV